MAECDICVEPFNKSTRKSIACPFCQKSTCLTCIKTYIQGILDPICMHCKQPWSAEFLRMTFPQSWLKKEYRANRERVMFDIEIAKLPDTQPYADAAKERYDLIDKQKVLGTRVSQIKQELEGLSAQQLKVNGKLYRAKMQGLPDEAKLSSESHSITKSIGTLKEELKLVAKQKEDVNLKIWTLTNTIEDVVPMQMETHSKVSMACPGLNCRGFLDKVWKCGVCKRSVCQDCEKIKEEDHTCLQEDIESVAAIRRDSKPCPKCSAIIYKILGCDQMWCTQCRTAFSWESGQIQNGNVHNPHYFEWMRQNPTENGIERAGNGRNRACGDLYIPSLGFQLTNVIRQKVTDSAKQTLVLNIARLIIHIQEVEIPHAILPADRRIPDINRELRIDYLLNRLSEANFKKALYEADRERSKRQEVSQILGMWMYVVDDLLERLFTDNFKYSMFETQLKTITDHANESLRLACKRLGLTTSVGIPSDYHAITRSAIKRGFL